MRNMFALGLSAAIFLLTAHFAHAVAPRMSPERRMLIDATEFLGLNAMQDNNAKPPRICFFDAANSCIVVQAARPPTTGSCTWTASLSSMKTNSYPDALQFPRTLDRKKYQPWATLMAKWQSYGNFPKVIYIECADLTKVPSVPEDAKHLKFTRAPPVHTRFTRRAIVCLGEEDGNSITDCAFVEADPNDRSFFREQSTQ